MSCIIIIIIIYTTVIYVYIHNKTLKIIMVIFEFKYLIINCYITRWFVRCIEIMEHRVYNDRNIITTVRISVGLYIYLTILVERIICSLFTIDVTNASDDQLKSEFRSIVLYNMPYIFSIRVHKVLYCSLKYIWSYLKNCTN